MNKSTKLLIINGLICVAILTLLPTITLRANADYCSPHSTKQCISNIVYWYNSCGVLEDLYQNCNTTNQICQNGQCVNKTPSLSPVQSPIQSSTPTPTPTSTPTPILRPTPTGTPNQTQNASVIISIFGQKESDQTQWGKNISTVNNDKINFLLVVKNISNLPINNVLIKTDITNNIKYADNLKIDNFSLAGNIVSGVDLGTIPPKTSRVIYFTGSVVAQTSQGVAQITASINSDNILYDSDYLTVNIGGQTKYNVATNVTGNSIMSNLKKNWYIWIMVIIILIALFIIIFRKISSNV